MNLDFELVGLDDGAEYDASDLNNAREKIDLYLSAGILFPKEIRNAERILRHLKKMSGPIERLKATEEIVSA